MRAFYDKKPSTMEAMGDGSYRYRWGIEEIVPELTDESADGAPGWGCEEAVVWAPLTSGKIINAVIRAVYTAEEELALVNKFNAYQQGMDVDPGIVVEYTEYLSFVAEVKRDVRKSMGEETAATAGAALSPRLSDIARLLSMTVNTMSLSDEESLSVKSVYPRWEEFVGGRLEAGMRVLYGDGLYKVSQDIPVVLAGQYPSVSTMALYAEITESHAGTLDDPIPYWQGMLFEMGKYYEQYGEIYLCVMTTQTGYPYDLSDLPTIVRKI